MMKDMKTEDAIGFGVTLAFIMLAWCGFLFAGFSEAKALFMALCGIPLGALAPVFLEPVEAV